MEIYILLITITLIASLLNSYFCKIRCNKVIYCIICIMLITVSCLRDYTVGIDTDQYVRAFYAGLSFEREYEIGFSYYLELLRIIYSGYIILLTVSSCVILLPIMYLIYLRSPNPYFSLFIMLCLNYYAMYLNAMRQSIALGIIIIGYIIYQKKDKCIYFLIAVLIAMCFHYTAIIALLYILIKKVPFSFNKFCFILLFVSVFLPYTYDIFYYVASNLDFLHYDEYVNDKQFSEGNDFAIIIKSTLMFIFTLIIHIGYSYQKKFYNNDETKIINEYLNFAAISTMLILVASQAVVIERLVMYFDFITAISLPFVLRYYRPKYRFMMYIILSLILILHWGVVAVYRPEWHGVIPYEVNSVF